MKRRDFFKFIPVIFVTPPVVNSMIQDDKLRSVYEWQDDIRIWKQIKWTDIKKGTKIKISGDNNVYITRSDSYPHGTGIYAVETEIFEETGSHLPYFQGRIS